MNDIFYVPVLCTLHQQQALLHPDEPHLKHRQPSGRLPEGPTSLSKDWLQSPLDISVFFIRFKRYCKPEIFNQYTARIFKTCNTYLVRGPDLFSLRLSNLKMATANRAITICCELIKTIPVFRSDWQKIVFLVCCRIVVISLCVLWEEKGWKSLF